MSAPHGFPASPLRWRGRRAAKESTEKNSLRVELPVIGTVCLPPAQQLAFVGGLAALVALDVIEWPVGVALTAGHVLASCSQNKVIQDFGHALEAA